MNESKLQTIEQIREFLTGASDVTFSIPSNESRLRDFIVTVIRRFRYFSLTYDIREIVPDFLRDGNPIPGSPSQEKKITSAVRGRLPGWIEATVKPVIEAALAAAGLQATLTIAGKENEKLIVGYPAVKTGTGYSAAAIHLEFGARATGEPHQIHSVACDIAPAIEGVAFPTAQALVMAAERTFWEKATAAHVYCLQGRLRGERYSQHWYDLAAMAKTEHFEKAAGDRDLALKVAEHKSMFFVEKDAAGTRIDYFKAVTGAIQLIPTGKSMTALEHDYGAMLEDGLLALDQPVFSDIVESCRAMQVRLNKG